jgi:hypothetical protein
MRIPTSRALAGAAAGLAALALAGEGAAQPATPLRIGAHVLRSLRLAADHPSTVTVSAADIARGVVEVRGFTVGLRSNTRDVYAIRGNVWNPAFAGIELWGIGAVSGTASAAVTYRLRLAPGARAGVYPWPVTLNVEAL